MALEWAFWIKMLVKVSERFEGTYNLHLQHQRVSQTRNQHEAGSKQSELHMEKCRII
jgi:hypothetical protein